MQEKNIAELLAQASKGIQLSRTERAAAKRAVMDFVAAHPRQPVERNVSIVDMLRVFFDTPALRYAVLGVFVFIVAGGGVTAAAERAPLDSPLHTIEVEVVEEMQAFFILGSEEKARFNTKRIEERVFEIQQLAAIEEVSEDTIDQTVLYIEEHTDEAFAHLEKVFVEDTTSGLVVATLLEEVLAEYEDELAAIVADDPTHDISTVLMTIDEQQENLEELQELFEEEIQNGIPEEVSLEESAAENIYVSSSSEATMSATTPWEHGM